jgi:predicted Zn-dependent protease with MMP-like domain
MPEKTESLQCNYCGNAYRLGAFPRGRKFICQGCGMEIVPLVDQEAGCDNTEGFLPLLGFFTIVALLGALGGIMAVYGWNLWVTFFLIGGIIYLVGRIFVTKYTILDKLAYGTTERNAEDSDNKYATPFDTLVVAAIEELPKGIRDQMSNVSVVVENVPNEKVLKELKMMSNMTLLGVFQGVPLNKRSVWQFVSMPEKITLYQNNIESSCRSEDEVKRKIKKIVRHEVAHFVGFTEEEIKKMGY